MDAKNCRHYILWTKGDALAVDEFSGYCKLLPQLSMINFII